MSLNNSILIQLLRYPNGTTTAISDLYTNVVTNLVQSSQSGSSKSVYTNLNQTFGIVVPFIPQDLSFKYQMTQNQFSGVNYQSKLNQTIQGFYLTIWDYPDLAQSNVTFQSTNNFLFNFSQGVPNLTSDPDFDWSLLTEFNSSLSVQETLEYNTINSMVAYQSNEAIGLNDYKNY